MVSAERLFLFRPWLLNDPSTAFFKSRRPHVCRLHTWLHIHDYTVYNTTDDPYAIVPLHWRIMSEMVSQITGVSIICPTTCSGADQGKHQSSALLAFVGGSTGDRWISLTKGQYRGKFSHLMTSSWHTWIWAHLAPWSISSLATGRHSPSLMTSDHTCHQFQWCIPHPALHIA